MRGVALVVMLAAAAVVAAASTVQTLPRRDVYLDQVETGTAERSGP
jgi:hypothetical protein